MAKKFGNIPRNERLYLKSDLEGYILAVDKLDDPMSLETGLCRFLLKYCVIGDDDYVPGRIYIIRELPVDGDNGETSVKKVWMDISITELGKLDPPENVWKRITADSIILHWRSPLDKVDTENSFNSATWDHDVVVRKRGSAPTSPNDGEVVGYSSIRSGRKESNGTLVVDTSVQYDEDTLGFVHPVDPTIDQNYFYRIFSVTRSGMYTGSTESLRSSWTWEEISNEISSTSGDTIYRYKKIFRIGDIFPMPTHKKYGTLHAQIVSFQHSEDSNGYKPHSITFMTQEVLGYDEYGCGGMSFSNMELAYAPTGDTRFKRNKTYYVYDGSTGQFREYDFTRLYEIGASIPTSSNDSRDGRIALDIFELNPSILYFKNDSGIVRAGEDVSDQLFTLCGNGAWIGSSISTWMNTDVRYNEDTTLKTHLEYDGYKPYSAYNETDQDKWYGYRISGHLSADQIDWKHTRNGWFISTKGGYHKLAPCYDDSAHIIDTPLFCSGFTTHDGSVFLDRITSVRNTVITDQYVNRKRRSTDDDSVTTDTVYSSVVINSKFWLPSYEEIYGTRPIYGYRGAVSTIGMSSVHESTRFELFNPGEYSNYNRLNRVKYDINGDPCAWWTRSIDPTSPGRVYFVDNILPDTDMASNVNITCTAHRSKTDKAVGAALCFTLIHKAVGE